MLYRRAMNKVTPKTLQENLNDWNKYLKNIKLSTITMHDLKPKGYIYFFENITKGRNNPIKSIDFSEFNYYVPYNSNKVYTLENRTITINEQALSLRQLQDDLTFGKSTTEIVPRIKGNT